MFKTTKTYYYKYIFVIERNYVFMFFNTVDLIRFGNSTTELVQREGSLSYSRVIRWLHLRMDSTVPDCLIGSSHLLS